jgi:hypothetical protein
MIGATDSVPHMLQHRVTAASPPTMCCGSANGLELSDMKVVEFTDRLRAIAPNCLLPCLPLKVRGPARTVQQSQGFGAFSGFDVLVGGGG